MSSDGHARRGPTRTSMVRNRKTGKRRKNDPTKNANRTVAVRRSVHAPGYCLRRTHSTDDRLVIAGLLPRSAACRVAEPGILLAPFRVVQLVLHDDMPMREGAPNAGGAPPSAVDPDRATCPIRALLRGEGDRMRCACTTGLHGCEHQDRGEPARPFRFTAHSEHETLPIDRDSPRIDTVRPTRDRNVPAHAAPPSMQGSKTAQPAPSVLLKTKRAPNRLTALVDFLRAGRPKEMRVVPAHGMDDPEMRDRDC